jgi:hypothetical protein
MSKSKAIQQARLEMESMSALIGALSHDKSVKIAHHVDTTAPVATRVHCGQKAAWKIEWRPYFPVFVGADTNGVLFGDSARKCT